MSETATARSPRVSTGIAGFDSILGGGLPAGHLYLVQGTPGSGKTTLALRFLLDGAARGESTLYVTLSETVDELREVARSHGWSLDDVVLFELAPSEDSLDPEQQYTILHPSEVELGDTMKAMLAEAERVAPKRVVYDSLSEMRLLAREQLRYRRNILALKRFFSARGTTVLMLDDLADPETSLETIAHGVITLGRNSVDYGKTRRRLEVTKLRGVPFQEGYHDFTITTGGLVVFPRLTAAAYPGVFERDVVESGVAALDTMLGGGLERGTSALLTGPAGAGKSVIAAQYAMAAARRGHRAAVYLFDERLTTFFARARSLGMELERHVDSGALRVQQIDPAEMSAGEFAQTVCDAVKDDGARLIVIDSLNGYVNAMPKEKVLLAQLHELLTFLSQQGVLTLFTIAQHGMLGAALEVPVDVSYLADSVVLLRYFEARGEVRKAISVVKRRSGPHETTIRELRIGPGVSLGEPLHEFQGVLTGVPTLASGTGRPPR